MSSHEEIKPTQSGNEELTMRRARLRGSLAKRALPPDPYAVLPDDQEASPVANDQKGKLPKLAKSSNSIKVSAHEEQASVPEDRDTYNMAEPESNERQATQIISPREGAFMNDSEAPSSALPSSLEDKVDKNGETIIATDANSSTGSVPASKTSTVLPTLEQTKSREQAIEYLVSIDQTLGACATNLAALQKVTDEQFDGLKNLAEMLQNQVFSELSLNLTSMMESLSAALEPMKAVGELVPAIDQLVCLMESREKKDIEPYSEPKLAPDRLITRLADQLLSGRIDAWTFKSACMAVYPADHPADLLHRLVELLGTQHLSGELFQAAYEAVQAAEPPSDIASGVVTKSGTIAGNDRVKELLAELESLRAINERLKKQNGQNDQHLLAELESLRDANEEYKGQLREGLPVKGYTESEEHKAIEELQEKLRQYEEEFSGALAGKDDELQEARELLNSRWEEFNTRYDELTESLHRRDELLKEKETDLQRKDSEIAQLKAQMEELQEQTKEMITSLQKQLSGNVPKEDSNKGVMQQGFFDVAPKVAQVPSLFDHGPTRRLLQQETDAYNVSPTPELDTDAQQSTVQTTAQSQGGAAQQETQPLTQLPPQPQAAQRQERTTQTNQFVSGAGSYGSGVRAQVFEVIVRQALAGAPWREICAGPMQVNNITPEEVETEVKHRQAILGKA